MGFYAPILCSSHILLRPHPLPPITGHVIYIYIYINICFFTKMSIKKVGPKWLIVWWLRTYASLKQNITFEEYLVAVQNIPDRIALTKLRLSNHSLMIEKGSHQGLQVSARTCPFCLDHIEDEFHFIIKCQTYTLLRQNFLDKIKVICIRFYYPHDEQFLLWFLLNNPTISHLTARYIKLTMELRAFLFDKHRNNTWHIYVTTHWHIYVTTISN